MRFKTYVFDLDGTLLNSKKELTLNTISSIEKLKRHGCSIILNSDRRFTELCNYAIQLNLGNNDFLLCRNGLYTYTGNGKLISKQGFLSIGDVKRISPLSKDGRVSFFTESIDYYCPFHNRRSLRKRIRTLLHSKSRQKELLSPLKKKKSIATDELKLLYGIKIEKVRLYCNDIQKLKEKYSVYPVADDHGKSDVYSKKSNKYIALVQLQRNGLISSLDDLLYFGDDINDKECFINLKYCISMKNAHPEIKKLAWMETDDCDNDGVANAIATIENGQ